jgi:2'-5' RNA ligase|tara:strand:+ start:82979 stop:83494 length:516 start_codon:yes stop_codon:yes gene_type:complete
MRVFIAIEIPKNLSSYLRELQKEFRGLAKIKFTHHFHMTLKFLGEIKEKQLQEVKEKLKNIKFKSFNTNLINLGVFPSNLRINVIWVGLTDIEELQKKIDETLIELFPNEQRFHSHLTLGRVKFVKHKKELLEKLKLKIEGEFEVKEFKLIESKLTKDGAKYITLESYELN